MTTTRFVLTVPCGVVRKDARYVRAPAASWSVSKGRSYTLFTEDESDVSGVGTAGHIVGLVVPRHGRPRRERMIADEEIIQITASEGRALFALKWGNYVAVMSSERQTIILRSPFGNLPCYYVASPNMIAVGSHPLDLLSYLGREPSINWLAIAHEHYRRDEPRATTALEGVQELLPGHELRISKEGALRTDIGWSPWSFVDDRRRPDFSERLHRTVVNVAQALTYDHGKVVVGSSGGLDSSVVAAALSRSQSRFSCLTISTRDPLGDERVFVRALTESLGCELIERIYEAADVDFGRSLVAHRPRPSGWSHEQAYHAAVYRVCKDHSFTAFVTGNGGDNVFYNTGSVRPVLDRWYAFSGTLPLLSTLHDVSRLTCTSLGAVAGRSVTQLHRSGRGYQWPVNTRYLADEIVQELSTSLPLGGPFDAPRDALPGQAGHIGMIARMQQHLESVDPAQGVPVLNPLAAQPVVELALSIPSWEAVQGGIDRRPLRDAFCRELPKSVINRSNKGSPEGFLLQLLRARLDEVRARLLDGQLAAHGIVDRRQLEAALTPSAIETVSDRVVIMALLDTEAWIDHWQHASTRIASTDPGKCQ